MIETALADCLVKRTVLPILDGLLSQVVKPQRAMTNIAAFYATTKLSWGLRKEVHGFVQENKAVMRVCGLEGSGINIWKEK